MPKWLHIVWALLPKRYIARLVLDGLMYLASKTKTELDDEFLGNIEEWMIAEGIIDAKEVEKIQQKHQQTKVSRNMKKEHQ